MNDGYTRGLKQRDQSRMLLALWRGYPAASQVLRTVIITVEEQRGNQTSKVTEPEGLPPFLPANQKPIAMAFTACHAGRTRGCTGPLHHTPADQEPSTWLLLTA